MARKKLPVKIKADIKNFLDAINKSQISFNDVFLFGSYAKGTYTKYSDIDLCIVSDELKDDLNTLILLSDIKSTLGYTRVEPIALNSKDFTNTFNTLAQEVKKTGVKIKLENLNSL